MWDSITKVLSLLWERGLAAWSLMRYTGGEIGGAAGRLSGGGLPSFVVVVLFVLLASGPWAGGGAASQLWCPLMYLTRAIFQLLWPSSPRVCLSVPAQAPRDSRIRQLPGPRSTGTADRRCELDVTLGWTALSSPAAGSFAFTRTVWSNLTARRSCAGNLTKSQSADFDSR